VQRLQDFARAHDVVIFVGGKKSSNARVLFNHCLEANPRTIFVSQAEEVDSIDLSTFAIPLSTINIGICGGTSTPLWLMEKVKDSLLTTDN
jgi:4-hydroxy-3-methylbut-2-enyl diphosphate reductase